MHSGNLQRGSGLGLALSDPISSSATRASLQNMLQFASKSFSLSRSASRYMSSTKVAVVGCGALGLNYGTRLLEAQLFNQKPLDVSLVLRRDYELVSQKGLQIEYGKATEEKRILKFSPDSLKGTLFPTTSELVESKGKMDWVIVCCKSYSIDDSLRQSIEPLMGVDSKLMVIMNGLGVEDPFIEWFGADRVYGALSLIACNCGPNPPVADGPLVVNVYLDLKLEVAHVSDDVQKTQAAIDLFGMTSLQNLVVLSKNLIRSRWDKLCWNLTFAGIGVAMGGLTCDVIVNDPSLRRLANGVIKDVIRVANADILRQHRTRHLQAGVIEIPPCLDFIDETTVLEEIWPRTENAGTYRSSTVLDLVSGQPLEMRYLFGVPLQRARELQELDPTLQFTYLESVILMVEGVSRMSERKTRLGVPWCPTFFTDEIEK